MKWSDSENRTYLPPDAAPICSLDVRWCFAILLYLSEKRSEWKIFDKNIIFWTTIVPFPQSLFSFEVFFNGTYSSCQDKCVFVANLYKRQWKGGRGRVQQIHPMQTRIQNVSRGDGGAWSPSRERVPDQRRLTICIESGLAFSGGSSKGLAGLEVDRWERCRENGGSVEARRLQRKRLHHRTTLSCDKYTQEASGDGRRSRRIY